MDEDRTVSEEATNAPPRPGLPLIVCSSLVMGLCAFFVSVAVATVVTSTETVSITMGMSLLMVSFLFGLIQYLSVFRSRIWATIIAGSILLIVGFLLLVWNVTAAVVEYSFESERRILLDTILILFPVCVLFLVTGELSRRWVQKLVQDLEDSAQDRTLFWQITTRELFLATAVVALISALSAWLIRSSSLPQVI